MPDAIPPLTGVLLPLEELLAGRANSFLSFLVSRGGVPWRSLAATVAIEGVCTEPSCRIELMAIRIELAGHVLFALAENHKGSEKSGVRVLRIVAHMPAEQEPADFAQLLTDEFIEQREHATRGMQRDARDAARKRFYAHN